MPKFHEAAGGDDREYELPPTGVQHAIFQCVVEIGTHTTTYGDKKQLMVGWELNAKRADGSPFWVKRKYTDTWGSTTKPSNLRKDIQSFLGTTIEEYGTANPDFELDHLIDTRCALNLGAFEYEGKSYVGVNNVLPAIPGNEDQKLSSIKVPNFLVELAIKGGIDPLAAGGKAELPF